MIKRALKKVKWKDLILAYQRLRERGYTRSYGGFRRLVQKLRLGKAKAATPKRKPKPYAKALYPGQKVQIDVKYVPKESVARNDQTRGKSYYQFGRSLCHPHNPNRQRHRIHIIQTDNGTEFTNALIVADPKTTHKTLFEQALIDLGIFYKRIRIATPRHNGKVERMHRTDQMRFYDNLKMFDLQDGRKQLTAYNKRSNNYIMTVLDMKSPNEVLKKFWAQNPK
jgi:transposase InsO family protein